MTRHPTSPWLALPLLLASVLTLPSDLYAQEASSSAIVREVMRPVERPGSGVVQFWWLPTEYCVASAHELGLSPAEVETVRRIFQDYLLVGALDIPIAEGAPKPATIAEIVQRIEVWRGAQQLRVLREVNPTLVERAPQLSYAFKTSLQPLGVALRILPLPNVDRAGQPILSGDRAGELRILYRPSEGGDPVELRWHGPLTSVVGAATCPVDGEKLDASFAYCPYHGSELRRPTGAAPAEAPAP